MDHSTGARVVIELKRGRPTDEVVGQAARDKGRCCEEFAAPGLAVEGLIVAGDADDRPCHAARAVPGLDHAAWAVPGLDVLLYEVTFGLQPAERPAR